MTFKIRERHFLRSKLIKQLRETIKNKFLLEPDLLIPKNSQVELIKSDEINLYVVNKQVMFIEFKEELLPSIQAMIRDLIILPKVTVDKGAIPYVTKGAQVMVPGITEVDPNIKNGDYVVIVDETHNKPIAIGIALMDSEQIKNSNKGKAIQNLHYVGDKIWTFIKQLD
ncbi:MAG: DUF1947 domain-containing protein [Candidatus Helarchaeota archaeon]|nr:DUF1947 domain-containing protein [Candidatus Helarchaeota archaeon]